jgi:hypothetical protein
MASPTTSHLADAPETLLVFPPRAPLWRHALVVLLPARRVLLAAAITNKRSLNDAVLSWSA